MKPLAIFILEFPEYRKSCNWSKIAILRRAKGKNGKGSGSYILVDRRSPEKLWHRSCVSFSVRFELFLVALSKPIGWREPAEGNRNRQKKYEIRIYCVSSGNVLVHRKRLFLNETILRNTVHSVSMLHKFYLVPGKG